MFKSIGLFMNRVSRNGWVLFVAVVLFSGFQMFYRLDALPVQNLDEARQGTTAFEMLVSGDYAKSTYLWQADHYNTKPPLLFWIMTLSYRVFGISIFAFRFPSALFGLLTVVLTMLVARRYFGKTASLLSGVILSTTYAFVHFHAARKGDFDSLFVFFMTAALALLLESERRKFLFVLSGLAAGLSFLTKSFAALQVFAVTGLYLAATGRWKHHSWKDYLGYAAFCMVPILAWGVFRYSADGLAFFQSMIQNDLVIRTTRQLGTSSGLVFYYFGVVAAQFFPWSVALVFSLFYRNSIRRIKTVRDGVEFRFRLNASFRETLFAFWIVIPFVLFSLTTVRLDWYIMGIYPPLSILVGWYLSALGQDARRRFRKSPLAVWPQFAVAVMAVLFTVASVAVVNIQDAGSDQRVILDLRETGNLTNSFYFINRGENYGEVYLAEVLKKYRVRTAGSGEDFLTRAQTGDVVHLPDNEISRKFVETGKLRILAVASGWLIAQK